MTGYGGKNCMNCSADLGTAENPSTFYALNCNSRVNSTMFADTVELVPVPRALSTIFNFDTLERVSKVSDSPLKDFESSATSVPICFVCYMVLSDLYRTYTEFSQLRKANSFLGSKLLDLENCFKSHHHRSTVGEASLKAKISDENPPLFPMDFVKVEAGEDSNPEETEYDMDDTGGVTEDEEQGGQVDDDEELLSFTSSLHLLPSVERNMKYEPFNASSVTPNKRPRYQNSQINPYTPSSSKQVQQGTTNTGTRKGSKNRISNFQFTIPPFDEVIMRGLTGSGNVDSVWMKVVDVVARTLLPLNIGNKSDYAIVGQTLVGKYERLGKQSSGNKPPWTQLMRCISTKLRNLRKIVKLADLSIAIDSEVLHGPVETVCDQTFRRKSLPQNFLEFEDSHFTIANEAINVLSMEIAKGEQRSESVIKDCWEKAFISRTHAIQNRISPPVIIKQHPLLLDPTYLVMEAKLLLGEDVYLKLERNISKFVPAVMKYEHNEWAASALKKFQSSYKDQSELIVFYEERAELEQYLHFNAVDSPQLLVPIQEKIDSDESVSSCILLFGQVINDVPSLEEGIKILILLYLVLDLDIPQKFQKFFLLLQSFCFGFKPVGIGMSQRNRMVLLKLLSVICKDVGLP